MFRDLTHYCNVNINQHHIKCSKHNKHIQKVNIGESLTGITIEA